MFAELIEQASQYLVWAALLGFSLTALLLFCDEWD